jgi:hypothetical protein
MIATSLAISACLALLPSAPHGVAVSAEGGPAQGVEISQSRSGPWVTTSADGSWSLGTNSVLSRSANGVARQGRWLRVDNDAPITAKLSTRDANGRQLVADRTVSLAAGTHRIDLGISVVKNAIISWVPVSAGAVASRHQMVAGDSLFFRWNGKLWHSIELDLTSDATRIDTLDLSENAISLEPVWTLLNADTLPGMIGPLSQFGDTLFAAVGNDIWSIPATGGTWRLDAHGTGYGQGFLDFAVSGDTLFASMDFGADTSLWIRTHGKPWVADPWAAQSSGRKNARYRLCAWGKELYLGSSSGDVWMRRSHSSAVANTGSQGGSMKWLGVLDTNRFVFSQAVPRLWSGQEWQTPRGYGTYQAGAIWNGKAVMSRQLESIGYWDVFAWDLTNPDLPPTRFADSTEQNANDLLAAGQTLCIATGQVKSRNRSSSTWTKYPTPPGFYSNRIGRGPHRVWVGGQGLVGWLE